MPVRKILGLIALVLVILVAYGANNGFDFSGDGPSKSQKRSTPSSKPAGGNDPFSNLRM